MRPVEAPKINYLGRRYRATCAPITALNPAFIRSRRTRGRESCGHLRSIDTQPIRPDFYTCVRARARAHQHSAYHTTMMIVIIQLALYSGGGAPSSRRVASSADYQQPGDPSYRPFAGSSSWGWAIPLARRLA